MRSTSRPPEEGAAIKRGIAKSFAQQCDEQLLAFLAGTTDTLVPPARDEYAIPLGMATAGWEALAMSTACAILEFSRPRTPEQLAEAIREFQRLHAEMSAPFARLLAIAPGTILLHGDGRLEHVPSPLAAQVIEAHQQMATSLAKTLGLSTDP